MWITIRGTMFLISKGIVAFGLGGVILWQVAVHIGPQNGVAYVHVSTPNVDVMIDDVPYHIETLWVTRIVCELRPGPHKLRMCRGGRMLYEQEFTLGIGQEIVLMAWEPPGDIQAQAALPDPLLNKRRRP